MKKKYNYHFLIVLFVLLSSNLFAQVGTGEYPNAGNANVNGSITGDSPDWNLTVNSLDWFAPMYESFNNNSKDRILANLYLRYDCETEVMYVLVYQAIWNSVLIPLVVSAEDAWIAIDSISNKVVLGSSGDDGVPPDFQWIGVGYDGAGTARGYEASFSLPKNTVYSIIAHVNATYDGETATSGTVDEGLDVNVDCTALPVELTSFNVNLSDDIAQLNWETATEVNNYGFEIQRATDNKEWSKVGFVQGHGNSNSPKYYTYSDKGFGHSGNYSYRLKQIDIDGAYEYSDVVNINLSAPADYKLHQNYPNPFNPTTKITYSIPTDGYVTLSIYDVLGNEVAQLENSYKSAGQYSKSFDASKLTSGIYIYTVRSGNFIDTKKMLLIK